MALRGLDDRLAGERGGRLPDQLEVDGFVGGGGEIVEFHALTLREKSASRRSEWDSERPARARRSMHRPSRPRAPPGAPCSTSALASTARPSPCRRGTACIA